MVRAEYAYEVYGGGHGIEGVTVALTQGPICHRIEFMLSDAMYQSYCTLAYALA
jgi:hypothetical protein